MNASVLFSRLRKTNTRPSSGSDVNNEDVIKLYQQLEKLTLETHNQQQTINAMKQKISDLEVRNEQLMETQQQISIQSQTKQAPEPHEDIRSNDQQQQEQQAQQKQEQKPVTDANTQTQTNIPLFSDIKVDVPEQSQPQQNNVQNNTFYVKDALAQMSKRSSSELVGELGKNAPQKISKIQIRVQQQQQRQEQTFNSPFGGYYEQSQHSEISSSRKHAEFEESDEEIRRQQPVRKAPTKGRTASVQRKISRAKNMATANMQGHNLKGSDTTPQRMNPQQVPQPQQIHKQVLFEDSLLEESFDEKAGVPVFRAKIQLGQPNIPKPNIPIQRLITQRPNSTQKVSNAQIMQPEIRKNGVLTQKIKLM